MIIRDVVMLDFTPSSYLFFEVSFSDINWRASYSASATRLDLVINGFLSLGSLHIVFRAYLWVLCSHVLSSSLLSFVGLLCVFCLFFSCVMLVIV